MQRTISLIALLTVLSTTLSFAAESVVFRKVDFYEDEGDKERKHDAR